MYVYWLTLHTMWTTLWNNLLNQFVLVTALDETRLESKVGFIIAFLEDVIERVTKFHWHVRPILCSYERTDDTSAKKVLTVFSWSNGGPD